MGCRNRKRRRRSRRLFWRVYIYGLVLLILVSVSVGAADYVMGSPSSKMWGNSHRFVGYVDAELTPLLDAPEELQAKVERVHRGFGVDVGVFQPNGTAIARAGEPVEPLEELPERPRWLRRGGTLPLDGGRAYVVARWTGGGFHGVLAPFVVLLVLALVSVPMARNIVRPIERITRAAREIGDGKLDARTGVKRRDEVGVLAAAFDDMATRLERLVAGEKELRANVSHELRTPLARMRVALEIAEEAPDPDAMRRHLDGIRNDITELEELIDQVLITARLDLGNDEELALRRDALDVAGLLEAATEKFRRMHAHEVTVSATPGLTISADPKLVKHVLDNLLENAAKYTAPGDGPITLTAEEVPGAVRLSVADCGEGVSDDELERLFEPFFRADSVRAQDAKGVGLGLSFCRRVAQAHDGSITAAHGAAGGLVVTLTLPNATNKPPS